MATTFKFKSLETTEGFTLRSLSDRTKAVTFSLSSLSSGQTRVITVPDASGTLMLVGDPPTSHTHAASDITSGIFDNARINFAAPPAIGSTTRNTGAFTTLSANNGTITASAPVLDLEQTWNNAAVAFTGVRFNAVRTAASDSSALLSLTVAGNNRFSVIDTSTGSPRLSFSSSGFAWDIRTRTGGGVGCNFSGIVGVSSRLEFLTTSTSTVNGDVHLVRESADTLAMVRSTNGQTFRLYNTQTDANNYERGFMRWSSNVLQIGTEKGGTGSARNLEFYTDNTFRARFQAEGLVLSSNSSIVYFGSPYIAGSAESNFSLDLVPFGSGNVIVRSGLLKFHGTTSSFPALKRSSTTLQVRLADDSAFAPLQCSTLVGSDNGTVATLGSSGEFRLTSTGQLAFASRGAILMSADGVMRLTNNAGTDFGRLAFGGTSASFPALKRSSTVLQSRLADDSDFAPLQGQLRIHQNAVSETITATHTLTLYDAAGTAYKVPCVAA